MEETGRENDPDETVPEKEEPLRSLQADWSCGA
jgi:hypothetical protein